MARGASFRTYASARLANSATLTPKPSGQPDDVLPAWVARAPLDVADPRLLEAGRLGELHLTDSSFPADRPDGSTERGTRLRSVRAALPHAHMMRSLAVKPRPDIPHGSRAGSLCEYPMQTAMLLLMQSEGLDETTIRANIDAAIQRKARALADYEAASAELAWWQQGAKLFGLTDIAVDSARDAAELEELAFVSGQKPTLRQAIFELACVIPTTAWTIPQLTSSLKRSGWLPARDDAQKAVSDMAAAMASDDQLERQERGVYRLHPRFVLVLETFSIADRYGALREAVLASLRHNEMRTIAAIREDLIARGSLGPERSENLVLRLVLGRMFQNGELGQSGDETFVRASELSEWEKS